MWDEAVVACQFHELNVEGSNPSPTKIIYIIVIHIYIIQGIV